MTRLSDDVPHVVDEKTGLRTYFPHTGGNRRDARQFARRAATGLRHRSRTARQERARAAEPTTHH